MQGGRGLFLGIFSTCFIVVVIGKLIHIAILLPATTHIHIDSHLSTFAQNALYDFLATCSSSLPYYKRIMLIKQHFNCIKNITIKRIHFNNECFYVESYRPIIRINQSHCVLENGAVVEKKWFDECLIQELNGIHCAALDTLNGNDVLTWHNIIDTSIFSEYRILWHKKTAIYVIPHESQNINVLTWYQQPLDGSLLAKLIASKDIRINIAKPLFDIRFKDQIIVCRRGDNEKCGIFTGADCSG